MARATQLRDLGEFELIERIARVARRQRATGVVRGIGDDAAVLRPRAGADDVVSTDSRVEGVHFRWETDPPRVVGQTALAAALSDLAAMGAAPRGFTWSFAAPPGLSLARFDGLTAGLLAMARATRCPLVGGNLTRARETSLHLTVLGAVSRGRALLRWARVGDRVFVTGTLGNAALSRRVAASSGRPLRWVPTPRLEAGRRLARIPGVRGCVDVSDGLLADLGHLIGPERNCPIDLDRLPRQHGFNARCRRLGVEPGRLAAAGGEDYELLFAMAPDGPSEAQLARRLGVRVTELGCVAAGPPVASQGRGWRHFRGRRGPA
ncbi:MAG: thiamine-phosphate kinase [Myxococcota bacterium]